MRIASTRSVSELIRFDPPRDNCHPMSERISPWIGRMLPKPRMVMVASRPRVSAPLRRLWRAHLRGDPPGIARGVLDAAAAVGVALLAGGLDRRAAGVERAAVRRVHVGAVH